MAATNNTSATTYIVLVKGRIRRTVAAVMSWEFIDIDSYDEENFRNELDASYIGRPWDDSTAPFEIPPPATVFAPENYDDRLLQVDPQPELKKHTRLRLWSAINGAGNLLYDAPIKNIIDWGIAGTDEPESIL